MAGGMRKMAVYLGLVEDDRYEEYVEVDEYQQQPSRDSRSSSKSRRGFADSYSDETDDRYTPRSVRTVSESRAVRTFRNDSGTERRPSVAPMADRRPAADLSRIETIHPRSYNDARRIGEDYRDGVPVIMNLSELDDADAKRSIDFAAGLVFGMRGSIERVTPKVFLLSPSNVDVGDQARAQLAEDGFFNQS